MTQDARTDGPGPRAFLAVCDGERRFVHELGTTSELVVGAGREADLRLYSPGVHAEHVLVRWDGESVRLRPLSGASFVQGRRVEHEIALELGEEVSIGEARLVAGLVRPETSAVRRALPHHEFRERMHEEVARAARSGRPTALAMIAARAGEGARIATRALESFRAGDLVGTYAHDEIELLLPDTPRRTARSVVTRLLNESGALGAVAGVAVTPDDGEGAERLERAARDALRRAIAGGPLLADPPVRTERAPGPLEAHDPATRELLDVLADLATDSAPVLLVGEVYCGKVRFARVLHERGARADGPFVVLPCAGPGSRGRMQRAIASSVQRAAGGTLVLDEVAELDPGGQAVLRAQLEAAPPMRLVATTHRAIAALVERGVFDAALYRRLAVEVVEVPPLRARPGDIVPLARRFAEQAGATPPVRLSAGALVRLRSYPWPGNVLELRNAMERAVRLAGDGEVLAEHLPSEVLPAAPTEGRLRAQIDSVERDAIVKALADANHNQTHAARRLGLSRRALIYKMEKYGLKRPPGEARRRGPEP
ncbi:MAG: sigma 54-interacting transcriptional regulator [Myxococcota bacterium]|nr:sigma 54-interacting transcriptional regulator [Myxococcota bacterium]MDW8362002.1 sigma 54-interacting transcriptional regulator [Myxococcales bacterium]